jgi:sugar/nucleoside kinase (ribokinase family)
MDNLRFPEGRLFDVVGLGEISIDHMCVVPRLPGADDKVRMSHYEIQGGGQIATALVACQRLGLKTKFLGKVGDDSAGRWSIEELAREGVEVSGIRVVKGTMTQLAVVLVDGNSGARTVIWQCDEEALVRPGELSREELTGAKVLHVDATGLARGLEPLRWAREAGTVTSIDIDHLLPDTEEALRLVDLCVVPALFPRELTGRDDLEQAMRAMHELNPRAVLCVTLGIDGCAAWEGDRVVREPAFQVRAVDTTACGDVFHAAFIQQLLEGRPLRRAMRFANAAAALKTRALGGRPGIATLAEVEAFLAGRGR